MKCVYILHEDEKGMYFTFRNKKKYVKNLTTKYTITHDNHFIIF